MKNVNIYITFQSKKSSQSVGLLFGFNIILVQYISKAYEVNEAMLLMSSC